MSRRNVFLRVPYLLSVSYKNNQRRHVEHRGKNKNEGHHRPVHIRCDFISRKHHQQRAQPQSVEEPGNNHGAFPRPLPQQKAHDYHSEERAQNGIPAHVRRNRTAAQGGECREQSHKTQDNPESPVEIAPEGIPVESRLLLTAAQKIPAEKFLHRRHQHAQHQATGRGAELQVEGPFHHVIPPRAFQHQHQQCRAKPVYQSVPDSLARRPFFFCIIRHFPFLLISKLCPIIPYPRIERKKHPALLNPSGAPFSVYLYSGYENFDSDENQDYASYSVIPRNSYPASSTAALIASADTSLERVSTALPRSPRHPVPPVPSSREPRSAGTSFL